MMSLTHLDGQGRATMVDVGGKPDTEREAIACGEVRMLPETLQLIREGNLPKGDVLSTARTAGIMAAKRTASLIPLCHPLALTYVGLDFDLDPDDAASKVSIKATVRCRGKTGVEMEALTAVAVAALTIYDMAKAVEKTMEIGNIRLVEKRGGRSGEWRRENQGEAVRFGAAGTGTLAAGSGTAGGSHGGRPTSPTAVTVRPDPFGERWSACCSQSSLCQARSGVTRRG